jgi:hypothetical protein
MHASLLTIASLVTHGADNSLCLIALTRERTLKEKMDYLYEALIVIPAYGIRKLCREMISITQENSCTVQSLSPASAAHSTYCMQMGNLIQMFSVVCVWKWQRKKSIQIVIILSLKKVILGMKI